MHLGPQGCLSHTRYAYYALPLDELCVRVLDAELDQKLRGRHLLLPHLKARLLNLQTPARSFHVGQHHDDRGNGLYRAMLDQRMIYSCGYWRNAANLDEALASALLAQRD